MSRSSAPLRFAPHCKVTISDQVKTFHSSKYYYGLVTAYYGNLYASHPIWFICENDELIGKGAEVLCKYSIDGLPITGTTQFTREIIGDRYITVQERVKSPRKVEPREDWAVEGMEI